MVSNAANVRPSGSNRIYIYGTIILAGLLVPAWLDTSEWQSTAAFHTILEEIATVVAIVVFGFSLARYRKTHETKFLFIAMAFLGTGILDTFHLIVTARPFAELTPSTPLDLIPWSWTASRTVLAILLTLSWAEWKRAQRVGRAGQTDTRVIVVGTLLTCLITIFLLAAVPLTNGYMPAIAVHRPQELLPGTLFALALVGYLSKGAWRYDGFEHWLIMALMFSVICQVLVMPFSTMLFDTEFDVAHAFKILSYSCVLIGCLQSDSPPATEAKSQEYVTNDSNHDRTIQGQKVWLSVGTKTAILCGLVALLASIPVAIQSSRALHALALEAGLQKLTSEAGAVAFGLKYRLQNSEKSLQSMALAPPITGIHEALRNAGFDSVENSTLAQWKTRLTRLMRNTMRMNRHYLEFVYVDAESENIQIRIARNDGVIRTQIESEFDLDKTRRQLTKDAENTRNGISWSRYRAYRENGEAGTQRIVADVTLPVYVEDGLHAGWFILCVDVADILLVPEARKTGDRWYVANTAGDLLAHPEGSTPSGANTDEPIQLQEAFPQLFEQLAEETSSGVSLLSTDGNGIEHAVGIFRTDQDSRQGPEPLLFASASGREQIEAVAAETGRELRLNSQIVLAFALLLGWIVAQLLSKPLRYIADAAQEFGETGRQQDLPVSNHDEIGMLAVSVNQMMTTVTQRSAQLEETIAQRQQDIQAIADGEARLRAVIDTMQDAQIVTNQFGTIESFNPAAEATFGYSRLEAIGQHVSILMRQTDSDNREDYITNYIETGEPQVLGKRLDQDVFGRHKDGRVFPIMLLINKFHVGEELFFSAVIRDITEQKQNRENLRRLATAVEFTAECIVILDGEFRFEYANPSFLKYSGFTIEELLGRKPSDLGGEKSSPEEIERLRNTMARGEVWSGMLLMERRDGSIHHEEHTISPVKDGAGKTTNYVSLIRDVTDRIEMENRRREAEQNASRFSRLLEQSLNEIYVFDSESLYFIDVNEGARENLGYSMDELAEMTPVDLKPEFTHETFLKAIEPLRTGQEQILLFTTIHERKDGTQYPVEVHLQLMADDETPLFCAFILDITERLRMEQQLGQAQKLESIGQLAAGIAHEINTPTQYVSDNTVFLQRAFGSVMDALQSSEQLLKAAQTGDIGTDVIEQTEAAFKKAKLDFLKSQVPPAFEQSLEGLERVSRIVGAMKEFSHPAQEKTNVDLNRAIQSTITVASNEWKYVADMQTEFDTELPLVPCLPGDFNQVVLNMIVNASHAISDVVGDGADGKGTITISTHQVGDDVEIRIADSGAGMPEDIRSKIFDAFFTTKAVGKGTGQGLSIAYNVVVEKHGGTIDVESEVGKGTTFIIHLPLAGETDNQTDTDAETSTEEMMA